MDVTIENAFSAQNQGENIAIWTHRINIIAAREKKNETRIAVLC